jgi:hypothetical protein
MNKLLLLFASLVCLLSPTLSQAQADTADHRKLYAEVNKNLGKMKLHKAKYKVPNMDYSSELRIWSEDGQIRKIEAIGRDDSGDVVDEHYFDNEDLVFLFAVVKGFRDGATKQHTVNEVRYYYKDSKIFKIVGGLDKVVEKDKKQIADEGKEIYDKAMLQLKFAKSVVKK